jgi:hypothetical protein
MCFKLSQWTQEEIAWRQILNRAQQLQTTIDGIYQDCASSAEIIEFCELNPTIIIQIDLDIEGVENVTRLCEPTLEADIIRGYSTLIFMCDASRIHTNLSVNRTH